MPEAEPITIGSAGAVRAPLGARGALRDEEAAPEGGVDAGEQASREFVRALLGQVGLHATGTIHVPAGVASQREALLSSEFVRTGGAGSGPNELLTGPSEPEIDGDSWSRSGRASEGSGKHPLEDGGRSRGGEAQIGARGEAGSDVHDSVKTGASAEPPRREGGDGHAPGANAAKNSTGDGGATSQASRASWPTEGAATGQPGRAHPSGGSTVGQGVGGAAQSAATSARGAVVGATNALGLREAHVVPKSQSAQTAPRAGATERVQLQLSRGLAAALRSAGKEISLRLTPEALGEVRVRVRFEGGGVVAQFEAKTAQARALLEESVGALRGAMESRGLHVERIEIGAGPDPGDAGDRASRDPGAAYGRGESSGGAQAGGEGSGRGGNGEHARAGGDAADSVGVVGRGSTPDGVASEAPDDNGDSGVLADGVVREGVVVLGVDALA